MPTYMKNWPPFGYKGWKPYPKLLGKPLAADTPRPLAASHFSLDIEGAEFLVLKSIDFQVVDIRVISVEVTKIDNIFDGKLTQLKYLMKRNGYELYKEVGEDYIYVKTKNKDELWKSYWAFLKK